MTFNFSNQKLYLCTYNIYIIKYVEFQLSGKKWTAALTGRECFSSLGIIIISSNHLLRLKKSNFILIAFAGN